MWRLRLRSRRDRAVSQRQRREQGGRVLCQGLRGPGGVPLSADDKGRYLHIHLYVNGGSIMLADPFPEHGCPLEAPRDTRCICGSTTWTPGGIAPSNAGAEVVLPLQRMFWGTAMGRSAIRSVCCGPWACGIRRRSPVAIFPDTRRSGVMKFMVLVKATKGSEDGVMPTTELAEAMMSFDEELVRAGVMLGGDGLQPSSKGARVHFSGSSRTVIDGPFAETKELVAGYWLWECKSLKTPSSGSRMSRTPCSKTAISRSVRSIRSRISARCSRRAQGEGSAPAGRSPKLKRRMRLRACRISRR